MSVVVPLAVVAAVGPLRMVSELADMFAGALLLAALWRPFRIFTGSEKDRKTRNSIACSTDLLLLNWKPLWSFLEPFGMTRKTSRFRLILVAIIGRVGDGFLIFFSRGSQKAAIASGQNARLSFNLRIPHRSGSSSPQQQTSMTMQTCVFGHRGLKMKSTNPGEGLVEDRMQPRNSAGMVL